MHPARHRRVRYEAGAILIASVALPAALLSQPHPADVEIVGHVLKPDRAEMTADRLSRLELPPGFTIKFFASDLGKPRILAVADDGAVYVTRREPGDIVMLRDSDGDGRADVQRVVVRRPMLHGLTFNGRRAYFVGVTDVFVADVQPNGTIGYVGPRLPNGDAPHHYHLEVFALDRPLPVAPGADRDTILAAMKGHVLAAGEIVGTFRRP